MWPLIEDTGSINRFVILSLGSLTGFMSKVALVTHDIQTISGRSGGVAAFVTHFGRLLADAGDEVTIILTRQETASGSCG